MLMTNVRRNPTSSTLARLNYCKVVRPVAFHQDSTTFSLADSSAGGVRPSPLAGVGAVLVALEITKNTTAAPKSATPTALVGINIISNLVPPTGLEVQNFPPDTNSNITLEGSSGANSKDSTYLGPHKNLPTIHDTTMQLSTAIK